MNKENQNPNTINFKSRESVQQQRMLTKDLYSEVVAEEELRNDLNTMRVRQATMGFRIRNQENQRRVVDSKNKSPEDERDKIQFRRLENKKKLTVKVKNVQVKEDIIYFTQDNEESKGPQNEDTQRIEFSEEDVADELGMNHQREKEEFRRALQELKGSAAQESSRRHHNHNTPSMYFHSDPFEESKDSDYQLASSINLTINKPSQLSFDTENSQLQVSCQSLSIAALPQSKQPRLQNGLLDISKRWSESSVDSGKKEFEIEFHSPVRTYECSDCLLMIC